MCVFGTRRDQRPALAKREAWWRSKSTTTTTATRGIDEKKKKAATVKKIALTLTFPAASAATKRATTTRVSDSVVSMSCGDMVTSSSERTEKGKRERERKRGLAFCSFSAIRERRVQGRSDFARKLFFFSLSLPHHSLLSLQKRPFPFSSKKHGPSLRPFRLRRLRCRGEAGEEKLASHEEMKEKKPEQGAGF